MSIKEQNKTKRGTINKYFFKLFLQRVIGFILFALAAGTIKDLRGIINFSMYFIISIIVCIVMYKGHQETLYEREKKQENTKRWDKILLPMLVLLTYYGIYLVAGFGVRFKWMHLSDTWLYVGILIYLISSVFTVWPILENRHFEATSRIQDDREQTVISTGPYQIVRHPGYLGIIIWAIATALIFGTLHVGITSTIIITIIIIRTYMEDTMLKKELSGYTCYTDKVKYRLFPFIW